MPFRLQGKEYIIKNNNGNTLKDMTEHNIRMAELYSPLLSTNNNIINNGMTTNKELCLQKHEQLKLVFRKTQVLNININDRIKRHRLNEPIIKIYSRYTISILDKQQNINQLL